MKYTKEWKIAFKKEDTYFVPKDVKVGDKFIVVHKGNIRFPLNTIVKLHRNDKTGSPSFQCVETNNLAHCNWFRLKPYKEKQMKLKDVKIETGMIIVMENKRGLVLDNEVFYFDDNTMLGSDTINHTLNKYSILKILKPNTPKHTNIGAGLITYLNNKLLGANTYMKVVWRKEPEAEEMTMEEICKVLGKQVKIVKA